MKPLKEIAEEEQVEVVHDYNVKTGEEFKGTLDQWKRHTKESASINNK